MSLVEEVGGGLDGLRQLRALMSSGRKPGILLSLDFQFVEVESGRAVFTGTPGEHAYNPIGTVHGGYAATLLDSACGCGGPRTLARAARGIRRGEPQGLGGPAVRVGYVHAASLRAVIPVRYGHGLARGAPRARRPIR